MHVRILNKLVQLLDVTSKLKKIGIHARILNKLVQLLDVTCLNIENYVNLCILGIHVHYFKRVCKALRCDMSK